MPVHSVQVNWVIWLILPLARSAAWEVQLFRHGGGASNGPCRLVLLDINKQRLELQMCLWHDLQQGAQLWCDLYNQLQGKTDANLLIFQATFMQCLQL